jgi:hypothetical protein
MLLAGGSVASAKDPPRPPPPPADPEADLDPETVEGATAESNVEAPEVDGTYARALPRRPVILPEGAFEGSATFVAARIPAEESRDAFVEFGVAPGVKVAMHRVELEGALGLYLGETPDQLGGSPDRLQSGLGAIRFAPSPNYYVGARLGVINRGQFVNGPEILQYGPRLLAATKLRSQNTALQLRGEVGVEFLSEGSTDELIVVGADVRFQAQLARGIAVEPQAGFLLGFLDGLETQFLVGGSIVISPARSFDITLGVDVFVDQEVELTLFRLGVAGRYIP